MVECGIIFIDSVTPCDRLSTYPVSAGIRGPVDSLTDAHSDLPRLLEVISDLSKARTLDDVLQVVRVAARELTGADGATFVLRDGEHCYYAEEYAIAPLWKGSRFPLEACISGWAMLNRASVALEDIYLDPRIPADAYRPTFVKSLAMVPVRQADPLAAIGTYWATTHLATKRELWLLQTLADSTALALANVELYQDLKRKADEYATLYEHAQKEMANRQRLEEELRQSQKMEAVGRLAGGVAHDFNNLLTVITGYSDLILSMASPDFEFREQLEEIHNASDRAGSLTRQLLAFSRRQVLKAEVLDLNEVVDRMNKLLKRLIGEDIDLATRLRPDLHPVEFDPGQIEQIVMNLAVNARDAMPNGGRLTIETANVELDEEYARQHPDSHAGPHVMIAITDSGSGMTPEVKARIFDPFFTTKALGQGTGLGLSTVYGIVKQSGGNIWVYSEVGHGTTFKIYLPSAEGRAIPARRMTEPDALRGTETLLIVEDDAAVRGLLRRVLRQAGYTVLDTGDPEEALKICREYSGEIALLLTDVIMPKMGGREFAEKARILRPDMRTVYMSGYTDDAIVHHGVLEPGTAFIEKPISPEVLLAKTRGFLAED